MQLKNTESRFGLIAILFHWIMALLLIGMVVLGLYMSDLSVSPLKLKLYGIHKEFGVLILMLVMLRIVWRLSNLTPSLETLPWWEKFAARAVHYAFYFFMFAMPLTGWLMSSAAGLVPSFFGLFVLPSLMAPNHVAAHLFKEMHEWLAYALIATFFAHVGAALKHYFWDKDDILQRMLP